MGLLTRNTTSREKVGVFAHFCGLCNLRGVDLIGPLTLTPRGNRYIIVATDYFSKWPAAAPLQNKEATTVAHFMYSLYCRFGASDIITDQGREFINEVTFD